MTKENQKDKGILFMLGFMLVVVAICAIGFLFPYKAPKTDSKPAYTCADAWKDSAIYKGMSIDSVKKVLGDPYKVFAKDSMTQVAFWCDTLKKDETNETEAFVLYFRDGQLQLVEISKILL